MSSSVHADIITRIIVRGEPMKVAALAAGCHRSEWSIRQAIKQLIDEGELVTTTEGRVTLATATKEKAAKAKKDTEAAAPRSGPRAHTVEFDESVLKAIGTGKNGKTKTELAAATGQSESLVYGALHRLKSAGKVQKNTVEGSRTPTWSRAG